jgi:hypothetical protein
MSVHYTVYAKGARAQKGNVVVWTSSDRSGERRYVRQRQKLVPWRQAMTNKRTN